MNKGDLTCTAKENYYSEEEEELIFLKGDEIKIEKKLGDGLYYVSILFFFFFFSFMDFQNF